MKRYILKLKAWWIGRKKRNPHSIIETKVEEKRLPISMAEFRMSIKESILDYSIQLYTIIPPSKEEAFFHHVIKHPPVLNIQEPKRV